MGTVYVVVALVDYEGSTVMAVFDDEDAARAYLDLYQNHKGARNGPDYKASYDGYEVLPVELNATPLRYADLASIRPLGLK